MFNFTDRGMDQFVSKCVDQLDCSNQYDLPRNLTGRFGLGADTAELSWCPALEDSRCWWELIHTYVTNVSDVLSAYYANVHKGKIS